MSASIRSWGSLLVFAVAFVAMEPFTYLAHRYVMHGRGMVWHRSHHGKGPPENKLRDGSVSASQGRRSQGAGGRRSRGVAVTECDAASGVNWPLKRPSCSAAGPKGATSGSFERNDLFPVVFASLTIAAMAIGAALPAVRLLLPIGAGVTAYGMAYLVVHDIAIHRRVLVAGRSDRLRSMRLVSHLAESHALHHRFGTEPYGMLMPIVPASIRRRAQSPHAADGEFEVEVDVEV